WAGRDKSRFPARRATFSALLGNRRRRSPRQIAGRSAWSLPLLRILSLCSFGRCCRFRRRAFLSGFFTWCKQARTGTKNPTIRPVFFTEENLALARFAVKPSGDQRQML